MQDVRDDPAVRTTLLCAACRQVIGVYEPLVHVIDGVAHKTSRAADPRLGQGSADAFFHLACRDLGGADLVAVR
jgi:hypothetical protein